MVPKLEKSFVVNQTVHGYLDGHRLLKVSCELPASDLKTMLILSDASGSDGLIPDSGYITGYPLKSAGYYALAKTWAANEIERPGSVWTHTLLIDFADLATLDTFEILLSAFKRPTLGDLRGESTDLEEKRISVSELKVSATTDEEVVFIRRMLWALYTFPRQPVVSSVCPEPEKLIFKVWKQQWPRLRRSFRFCTLAFSDRSSPKNLFDFQCVPFTDKAVLSRFSKAVISDRMPLVPEAWLEIAMNDVLSPERTKFQNFLRSIGSEIVVGREAFAPLCEFYPIISDINRDFEAVNAAVEKIEHIPEVSKTIRAAVIGAASNFVPDINQKSFTFLIQGLDLVGTDQFERSSEAIGYRFLYDYPSEIAATLETTGILKQALERAFIALALSEIIRLIKHEYISAQYAVALRPELLENEDFWRLKGQHAFEALVNLEAHVEAVAVIKAVVKAEIIDLVPALVEQFGVSKVLEGIGISCSERHIYPNVYRWLDYCLYDRNAIADYLLSAKFEHFDLVLAIAHRVDPTYIPCISNSDPWLKVSTEFDEHLHLHYASKIYLHGFLLIRCFRGATCQPDMLIAHSFDSIYSAVEYSHIPGDVWDMLSPMFPKRVWIFDWDKCGRIRSALVDHFIDGQLSPECLSTFTKNTWVFEEISKEIAKTKKGRDLLAKVQPNLLPWQKKIIKPLLSKKR